MNEQPKGLRRAVEIIRQCRRLRRNGRRTSVVKAIWMGFVEAPNMSPLLAAAKSGAARWGLTIRCY